VKHNIGISIAFGLVLAMTSGLGCGTAATGEGAPSGTDEASLALETASMDDAAQAPGYAGLGGSGVACGDQPAPVVSDTKCPACVVNKCGSQVNAYLGNDPLSFGGACKDIASCLCSCKDSKCVDGCRPKFTEACGNADRALLDCAQMNCINECFVPAMPTAPNAPTPPQGPGM